MLNFIKKTKAILASSLILLTFTPGVNAESTNLIFFTQIPFVSTTLPAGIRQHYTLNQDWLRPTVGMTAAEYVASDDAAAVAKLQKLRDILPLDYPEMHILIDAEGINSPLRFTSIIDNASVSDTPYDYKEYFRKLKLRFDTIRRLFPHAQLGVYGYPIPRGLDITMDKLEPQMRGIREAARLGVLDSIDYLWVNVYQHFGPDDNNIDKIPLYTEAAVRQAMSIRRSDGSSPKIGVLYSQKVFNSAANTNNRLEVHVDAVKLQRDVVKRVAPWALEAVWDKDGALAGLSWWTDLLAP